MSNKDENEDKAVWAVPGGLMFGIGAGFFFFPAGTFGFTSVFAFVGCIMGGLGLGLLTAAILGSRK